jgi:outer membrane protein assembly factor BamB
VLRSLDTARGAELWQLGYEADAPRPVVTGGVVVAYVVPAGGGPSVLQAFDVATGEPRWTAPADPPGALVGYGESVLVADVYGAPRGVVALNARSGTRRWTAPLPGSGPVQLWPVEDGVVVNAESLVRLDAGVPRWSGRGRPGATTGSRARRRGWGAGRAAVPGGRHDRPRSGAAASSAGTAVLSVSSAALVARRGERVTVLAPG